MDHARRSNCEGSPFPQVLCKKNLRNWPERVFTPRCPFALKNAISIAYLGLFACSALNNVDTLRLSST